MNRTILQEAKEVAVSAAKAAGAIIKRRFDTMHKVDEKGDAGDVVTEADYEAEQVIVEAIERKFPAHRIRSEEAGQLGRDMIDAIVLYNSEGEDLYSGVLMVQEAGGQVMDFQGRPFRTMCQEPYLIACSPEADEQWLELVRQGIQTGA
ncbi:hypothetical protein ABD76_03220 [Paenibacillus dendritiformis]|uniref:inositol monophosphatase family protein n=1 Tax=Paenibacillus dendritiformis TaxID=130049 RepID=UPI0018CFE1ED|nr:inositol monophosphatase family protein [Paenibacillus dendritiformis]MBG9791575.1 hypothetical protein [Paenibacillus dendritiformis]